VSTKIQIFFYFFRDLLNGDPVAWTVAGILATIFGLFGLFWLKVRRDLRREDEELQRKRSGKGPKNR
jgi:hypothetical protein